MRRCRSATTAARHARISDLVPAAGTGFKADERWNKQHRNYRNQGPGCESCHGTDLKGTVLSRTADDRTVWCKDNAAVCRNVRR